MTTTQIAALVSTIQAEAVALLAEGILSQYVERPHRVFALVGIKAPLGEEDEMPEEIFDKYGAHAMFAESYEGAEQVSVTFADKLPDSNLRGIIFREASAAGLIGFRCTSKAVSAVETHTLGSAGLVLEVFPANLFKMATPVPGNAEEHPREWWVE